MSVCHSLSSDHLPEMCSLDTLKPELCPVLQTTRNLRAIDREQFRQDVASLTTVQPDITADQFNTQMHRLLDTHAPSTQRQTTRHRRSPSYSSIASELRSMKQERRRAERRLLPTKLTIHKEIMNSVKRHLVGNAKSTFCSVKVSTSSTVKEFYKVNNNLLGKITSTPLPSAYPTDQLPQFFSDFCVHKVRQIGDYIDIQVVHPPSHSLKERHFSGTPLFGFERVTNETVLKFISLVHPCVDLRVSPMELCEVHFSGTLLCGFERVTNETVLKFISLVHPCVDLRESPMKLY